MTAASIEDMHASCVQQTSRLDPTVRPKRIEKTIWCHIILVSFSPDRVACVELLDFVPSHSAKKRYSSESPQGCGAPRSPEAQVRRLKQ
jgi:hypothetical protein